MKLAIVTVSFNSVKTLERTILSVLEQSYKKIEYIVIDGASTDGSVEILEKYDDQITCWSSEADAGMYQAMNKGAEKATGDYLYFLNADDYFPNPHVIEDIINLLEKHDVDLLYGYIRLIYPTYQVERSFPFIDKMLSKGNIPPHQASFFKRILFEELGGYDERYKSAGDLDFYCRLKKRRIIFSRTDIIVANMNSGGVSSNKELAYDEARTAIEKHYGKYKACLFAIKKIYLEQGVKKKLKKLKLDLIYDKLARINNSLFFFK